MVGEGASDRFVGRAKELADLSRLVADAMAGRGRLVVVTGEAGIGKTRLCQEAADLAASRGMRVAWSACWESGGLPAFWPWAQLMDQLGAEMPHPGEGDSAPAVARAGMFASVAETLRGVVGRTPRLVVVDDLQWADVGTTRLLAYLAPVARSIRLLILATMRDESDATALSAATLGRLGHVLRMDGLSAAELRQLVEHVAGTDPGPEMAAELHHTTGGNPLFAAELARRLQDASRFGRGNTLFPTPPTVRAVLDERLAAVSSTCREVLEHAAVLGNDVRLPLLAAAANQEMTDVLAAVDEAVSARILAMAGPVDAVFCHPLVRSVLYDDIGVARRCALHRQAGQAIEDRTLTLDDADLAALSHHYLMAAPTGTAAKAAAFSAQAAERAMVSLAYEEAVELFDRALTANDLEPAGSDRGELLLGAAEAQAATGHTAEARRLYLAAAANARSTMRAELLARAALGLAGSGFEVTLFDDAQVDLLREALTMVDEDKVETRSRLLARLSVALSLTGNDDERAALAASAVALAEQSSDQAAVAAALAARCDAQAGPDHVSQRAADAERIVSLAHGRGDHATELLGRRLRLLASLEAGDLLAFDRQAYEFGRLADWLRQPSYQWYATLWRATRAAMRGRISEQARLADEAEALGRAAESANVEILLLAHRHFVWLELGESGTYLAETERLAPPGSWEHMGIQMLPLAVTRPLLAGRADEARAILDRAADELRGAPRDSEWLTLLAQIGDLCAKLGGHDLAGWLYDTLLPYAGLWSVDGIAAYAHGPVHRQLGTLAALLGRREQAERHFAAALSGNRAAGAELLVARTLLDRGVALDDRVALGVARDVYQRLGVDHRVEEVDRLLGTVAHPTGPASLRGEGDVWTIRFAGRECRVRDSKGMRDLARLLAAPGRDIAAADLAAAPGAPREGGLGVTLDDAARAAYKARLVSLEADLDDADTSGDVERGFRLQVEREALLAELSSAYGLGGRPRRVGDPAERARTAVTARIRAAIARIEAVQPDLGRHLARAVKTGTFCSYDPDPLVRWDT